MAAFQIVQLDRTWKGRTRLFRYWTEGYLDIQMTERQGISQISFCPRLFPKPVEKELEVSWMQDFLHDPQLFAAVTEREELAGYLELNLERWNNRMRVTNLFVEEPFRGQGVGSALMAHAFSVAKNAGARMMVLETQSCNLPAIRFYQSQGYAIGGFDLFHYSNEDSQNHEVRIEMMRFL